MFSSYQAYLTNQKIAHDAYLNWQIQFLNIFKQNKKKNIIQHVYLFDPKNEPWIYDHCPTFTRPSLPFMTIVDILVSHAAIYFPEKKAVTIKDLRVYRWALMDKPIHVITEIEVINLNQVKSQLFLNNTNKENLIASGNIFFENDYTENNTMPLPVTHCFSTIDNPYRYLFHGQTFQVVKKLLFGIEGSTMYLNSNTNTSGYLNHALLDGATHGIYHEGFSYWKNGMTDDQVCYPVLLKYMNFYAETPFHEDIRCETRFIKYYYGKTMPIFKMSLINNDKLWCEFELAFALLPMNFIENMNAGNFTRYLKNRYFLEDVHFAKYALNSATLSLEKIRHAIDTQWFPYLIEDMYDIDAENNIETITKNILIKDFYAQHSKSHPATIKILQGRRVQIGETIYHYKIKQHLENFQIENIG